MRNILLFEAFSAKTLSKTISFITREIKGKEAIESFKKDLIVLKNIYDIPIDKLTDQYFDYVPKKRAIEIRNVEVGNPYGISHIKFWFSVDNYIGFSAVGNKSVFYNLNDVKKIFTETEILYLTRRGFDGGNLKRVRDYSTLKTGDKVIVYLGREDDSVVLTYGTIYEEYNEHYVIQNEKMGSDPNGDGWRKYGNYSWVISRGGSALDDHKSLFIVENTKDGDELFELVVDKDGKQKEKLFDTNTSDFAIILDFDKLYNDGFDKVSDKKNKRLDNRKGATNLLSDDEIKNLNIDKYFRKITSTLGIEKDSLNLKNLQKIIKLTLSNKYCLITLEEDIQDLTNIIRKIYNMIQTHEAYKEKDEDVIKYLEKEYNGLVEYLKILNTEKGHKIDNWVKNIEIVKKGGDESKEYLENLLDLGEYVYKKCAETEIDSLVDLKIIINKLNSINNMLDDCEIHFYYEIKKGLYINDSLRRRMSNTKNKKIEKLVKSIFK
jgi:hypothetical protein